MGHRHTNLSKSVDHLVLRVLTFVLKIIILRVDDLAEAFICLFRVDLGELLHLHFVLSHQMSFFLGQVTEVRGRSSGKDLT